MGGLSDTLVRKSPPLAELLRKGVREIALEKVTGRSCSPAADEKEFKSVTILNSAQRWYREGSELNFTNLCQAVFIWGEPLEKHLRPLPPLSQHPAATKETPAANREAGSLHLPCVP